MTATMDVTRIPSVARTRVLEDIERDLDVCLDIVQSCPCPCFVVSEGCLVWANKLAKKCFDISSYAYGQNISRVLSSVLVHVISQVEESSPPDVLHSTELGKILTWPVGKNQQAFVFPSPSLKVK